MSALKIRRVILSIFTVALFLCLLPLKNNIPLAADGYPDGGGGLLNGIGGGNLLGGIALLGAAGRNHRKATSKNNLDLLDIDNAINQMEESPEFRKIFINSKNIDLLKNSSVLVLIPTDRALLQGLGSSRIAELQNPVNQKLAMEFVRGYIFDVSNIIGGLNISRLKTLKVKSIINENGVSLPVSKKSDKYFIGDSEILGNETRVKQGMIIFIDNLLK